MGRFDNSGLVPRSVEEYFLEKARGKAVQRFRRRETVYSQGEMADAAFFVLSGSIQLSMISGQGKEAVVALAGPSSLIGENCLEENGVRNGSAFAAEPAQLVRLERRELRNALLQVPNFGDYLISHLLLRAEQIEENLASQLFYSSEQRLARILTILGRPGTPGRNETVVPRVSQETLAAMVGTTRSRISFFMNKFRRAGWIEYGRGIVVRNGLFHSLSEQSGPDPLRYLPEHKAMPGARRLRGAASTLTTMGSSAKPH